jgi:hypothetical protein
MLMPLGGTGKNYHDDGGFHSKEDAGMVMNVIEERRIEIIRSIERGEGA